MRRAWAAVLLLAAAPAFGHEDAIVATSYDELWRRTYQALLVMGFTITAQNKDAGVITAAISDGAQEDWFTQCERGRGLIETRGYTVTILLNVLDEETTGVRVSATGLNTWYQNDHYGLFNKRRVRNTAPCYGSHGQAEKLVLSRITGSTD